MTNNAELLQRNDNFFTGARHGHDLISMGPCNSLIFDII